MPRGRRGGRRSTRTTPTTATKSEKRPHSNSDDTPEPEPKPTASGTSHGEVVGVDGTVATSGNKKPCRQPKMNIGSSQFSEIKETDHFVDKTKFIEVLFGDSEFVLITRPRRFGKSTIMNMVQEFVEKKVYTTGDKVGQEILRTEENDRAFPNMNLRLFEDGNFEISKWNDFCRHRGKYPIIHLNLKSINGDNYLHILLAFRKAIRKAFAYHSYLLYCENLWSTDKFDKKEFEKYLNPPSTIEDMIARNAEDKTMKVAEILLSVHIQRALLFLAEVLHEHFRHKVYLLIDDYNAPINNTILKNVELCEKVNDLLSNLFINLLKRQDSFIDRALITGISCMGSVGLSGVNNVMRHTFLRGDVGGDDRYEVFYGITEEELEKLTTKFTEKFWQGENKLPKEDVELYYNGYRSIGRSGVKIYPIWSIVNALENGELGHYWEQSGIMAGATEGLKLPIVRIAIEKLLAGESIKCEIPHNLELRHLKDLNDIILKWEEKWTLLNPDVVLSFLMQQGYLMYVKEIDKVYEMLEVKIPNTLVKNELKKLMEEYVDNDYDKLTGDVTAVFDEFPDELNDAILKKLIRCLEEAFEYVSQKLYEPNESVFHSVVFQCLCKSLKYQFCTELPGMKGRLDIAFMFRNRAIIIEIKHCKTAETAFEQIESKHYANILMKSLSNKNLQCVGMGVNVDENNKVSICYKNADATGSPRLVSSEK